jgi:Zn finger protein HypA/HybF involved in hydrogenase expression
MSEQEKPVPTIQMEYFILKCAACGNKRWHNKRVRKCPDCGQLGLKLKSKGSLMVGQFTVMVK